MKDVKIGLVGWGGEGIPKGARLHPRPLILGNGLAPTGFTLLTLFNTLFCTIEISPKKIESNNK
jgi:hypothetical protein